MSDETLIVTEVVNSVTVTPVNNTVTVSEVGTQGPAGATGATGATGAQGSSGVVSVNAPITNTGTSSAANIGLDQSNIGLKYASPWQVKYRSGYYYEAKYNSSIGTGTIVQNRLYCWPLFITEPITLDRIAVECTTLSLNTTWRIGIYNSDSDGLPSTVVLDAGTVSTATTGFKVITISQSLSAGLYFIAGVWQGGSGSPTMRVLTSTAGAWTPVASTSQQGANNVCNYQLDGVTGALDTFSGSTTGGAGAIRTQFRIA